jgi:hypothetical protein
MDWNNAPSQSITVTASDGTASSDPVSWTVRIFRNYAILDEANFYCYDDENQKMYHSTDNVSWNGVAYDPGDVIGYALSLIARGNSVYLTVPLAGGHAFIYSVFNTDLSNVEHTTIADIYWEGTDVSFSGDVILHGCDSYTTPTVPERWLYKNGGVVAKENISLDEEPFSDAEAVSDVVYAVSKNEIFGYDANGNVTSYLGGDASRFVDIESDESDGSAIFVVKETASQNELWIGQNADVANMPELSLFMPSATAALDIASVHMIDGLKGFVLTTDEKAYYTDDGFASVVEQGVISGSVKAVVIAETAQSRTPFLLDAGNTLHPY